MNFGAALHESDAYREQFHTENPHLLHWLVSLSYRISLGNVKDEDLKELGHDL